MRKQMKANKITKRALALVLTMSLVFGLAFTVYAQDDTETAEPETTETASESSEPASTQSEPAPAQSESTPQEAAAAAAVETAGEATTAIQTAEEAVDVIVIGADIVNELENAEALINGNAEADGAVDNLEEAQSEMADAVAGFEAKETLVENLEKKNAEVKKAVDQANKDIATANTTKSETKAIRAAAAAADEVEEAKAALAEAEQQVEEIQTKWEEANNKQIQAQQNAEKALQAAKENTGAALAALNAARAQMETLDRQKAALKELKEQYFETMVHYYRDANIKCDVYDEDGNIDLEKSAKKAYESGKLDKHPEVKPETWEISRELMRQLVYYKIIAGGADPESISFAAYDKANGFTNKKVAAEGELTKDNNGNDRVVLKNKYDQYWENGSGDNGRNNHVKVTYTDKDGNEVTEYYNYIAKTAQYDDFESLADAKKNDEVEEATNAAVAEMKKGPIFLAMVKKTDQGWKYEKDTDTYNLDDYEKLTEALNATEGYEAAKDAVKKAEDEVARLQQQVDALTNVSFDDAELKALEDRLAEAKEKKSELEEELKKAEEALDKIDLSRFEVVPADDDDDEDTTSGTTTAPVIASITPAVTVIPVLPEIVPVASAATTPVIANLIAAADDTPAAPEAVAEAAAPVILEDEVLPAAAEAPETLSDLADDELPAAQAAEEGISLWWLWILLLIVALIVAYTIYRYNEKKKEENNTVA